MRTLQDIITEKSIQLEEWAKSRLAPDKQYRIRAYITLRKISVEVYSPNKKKWSAVYTISL